MERISDVEIERAITKWETKEEVKVKVAHPAKVGLPAASFKWF